MVSKRVPKPSRKAAQNGARVPLPPPPPQPGDVNWRFHHLNLRLQPHEIQGDLDVMLVLAERYEELRAVVAERAGEEGEETAAAGYCAGGYEAMESKEHEQRQPAAIAMGAGPLGAARAAPPVVNSIPVGMVAMGLVASPGAKASLPAAPMHQLMVQQAVVRV